MVVSSLTVYMSFSKASLSIVGASSSLASSLMSLNLHHHFLNCHRLYSAIFIGVVMMPRCHCPRIVLCSGLFAWECPITQFVNPFRLVAVSGNLNVFVVRASSHSLKSWSEWRSIFWQPIAPYRPARCVLEDVLVHARCSDQVALDPSHGALSVSASAARVVVSTAHHLTMAQ